jgi:hypothetical protein
MSVEIFLVLGIFLIPLAGIAAAIYLVASRRRDG